MLRSILATVAGYAVWTAIFLGMLVPLTLAGGRLGSRPSTEAPGVGRPPGTPGA